jgi:hypothetical protein
MGTGLSNLRVDSSIAASCRMGSRMGWVPPSTPMGGLKLGSGKMGSWSRSPGEESGMPSLLRNLSLVNKAINSFPFGRLSFSTTKFRTKIYNFLKQKTINLFKMKFFYTFS